MRRPTWVRKSGPYKCHSQGSGYIQIKPSWPQFGAVWEAGRGGGPGIFSRMELADRLEAWLNSIYTVEEIDEGHTRIEQHDRNLKEGWPDPNEQRMQKLKAVATAARELDRYYHFGPQEQHSPQLARAEQMMRDALDATGKEG